MLRISVVVVLTLLSPRCHGYRFFQDRIPNGDKVPHPCRQGSIWSGVGHENEMGGGVRNPFGLDFHTNDKRWDRTLCLKDSDGDGISNGQELGDPDCTWEVGKTPSRTTELSHPGICDPWNSPQCEDKTAFVSCGPDRLVCPAIEDTDTFNFTVRMPKGTPVEARETIYKCVTFDFPQTGDFHLVANEPIIDNVDVMHHTIIFGCSGTETKYPPGEPFDCGMELHWNNPQERADYTDSSGMLLHLTTKLRPNDAGILMVGQDYLQIPPQETKVRYTGVCSSECTQSIIKKEVKVPVAFNHMHGLGVSQKIELIRDGRKLRDVTFDPVYDYNTPVLHTYDTPLTLKPGDELRTECIFNSMSRTTTTFYGDGTYDEMCYGFITFYPKENIPEPLCSAWQNVPLCSFNISEEILGCRFKELHDITIPSMKATYDLVMENCSPYIKCRKECLPVVRNLKKTSCYTEGTINDWARLNIEKESPNVTEIMKFYAALDSCDDELFKENTQCPPVRQPEQKFEAHSAGNHGNTIGTSTLVYFMCLYVFSILFH
ncbi:hypothetical protein ACF0H5_021252 [Mactra antiquata]